MHSHRAISGADAGPNFSDREARGVRSDERIGRGAERDATQELDLELHLLGNRLDGELDALGAGFDGVNGDDASQECAPLVGGESALVDAALGDLLDRRDRNA